ncbi:hypothetical protein [Algoriphagus sp.]|uniref:hypothetical protein n=1 Tax=Algoriphagus sp. TaxID=1872435 RepID=UPI0025F8B960|nr:hypothetical protein [Algoriphagus sp.]
MKNLIFNSVLKYLLLLPLLIFAGCNMDNSDQPSNLDELNLKDGSVNKTLPLLSENKEFMDALRKMAAAPKGTEQTDVELYSKSNKKWVAMASGGGKDLYPDSDEPNFEITFSAREDADGNDVGKVNWKDTEGNVIASGEVDCLYVEGNRAWVRYVFEVEDVPFLIWIGFEDNGEGSKAESDRHTYIYGGLKADFDYLSCEDFAASDGFGDGFPVEWVRGNVQVN